MEERVHIVVLKYKVPDIEKQCINHIIDNTNVPYRLTVLDTRNIKCHFSKIWNQLIQSTNERYICILDSDAFVPPDWLEKMLKVFDEKNNVSVVVPSGKCGNDTQTNTKNNGIIEMNIGTPFVGLYRRDVFNDVGYFDEDQDFAIFGQDSEWIMRADKMGYKCYLQSDVIVEHLGNTSTMKAHEEGEINFDEERIKASNLFKKKIYGN